MQFGLLLGLESLTQGRSLGKIPRVETFDQKAKPNCVFKFSKSRRMYHLKDKFDAVRRNPYSIN